MTLEEACALLAEQIRATSAARRDAEAWRALAVAAFALYVDAVRERAMREPEDHRD